MGDISADITSNASIAGIMAVGQVNGTWNPFDTNQVTAYNIAIAAWQLDPDPENMPKPPRLEAPPQNSARGNIIATIESKGSIGQVVADGDITGDITSQTQLRWVAALGNIVGNDNLICFHQRGLWATFSAISSPMAMLLVTPTTILRAM